MKKTIITLALAAFALVGVNASAQTEKACTKAQCEKQTGENQLNENNRMRRPATWREYAFEGVLLSLDQQTKIDEINKEFDSQLASACKKDSCQKSECTKPDCKKVDCKKADCKKVDCKKDSCQKVDCKKVDCKKDRRGDRAGKGPRNFAPNFELRSQYIARVKQVLTPEQYTTFLENIVNMPSQRAQASAQNGKIQPRSRQAGDQACPHHKMAKRDARDARQLKADVKKDAQEVKADLKKGEKKAKADLKKGEKKVKSDVKKGEKKVKSEVKKVEDK